ncbi:AsnC family transcriptional regulator [Acidovorax sp. D2M1]|uniref:siroheme decarboxylase n=1 Tax=Acidovorax benzenivorans TaxID=2987520 RepID=A0ABT5RV96_9BURK|nr:AsnC family transcriptional regulator [Acidovorax benzenivorans]MDD2177619.1 AsnC family transcriptional regulator [Acidovorax benzenivorans]
MALDDFDRALIAAVQSGLPLVARPYEAVGAMLGVDGERVRARLAAMLDEGLVRRIGAVPNHYRLGFTANGMSVWDVADDQVDTLARQVAQLTGVSHCYRRTRHLPEWPYNLFAMLHGRSQGEVQRQADVVAALLGPACRAHDILYSTAILKKTGLRLKGTNDVQD